MSHLAVVRDVGNPDSVSFQKQRPLQSPKRGPSVGQTDVRIVSRQIADVAEDVGCNGVLAQPEC